MLWPRAPGCAAASGCVTSISCHAAYTVQIFGQTGLPRTGDGEVQALLEFTDRRGAGPGRPGEGRRVIAVDGNGAGPAAGIQKSLDEAIRTSAY